MKDDKKSIDYKTITKQAAIKLISNIEILLMTATDTETKHLHQEFEPFKDNKVIKFGADNNTYYIGKFGNYNVIHVQCKAGSVTSSGSSLTTQHALSLFNPKIIVMIGIAFGIDSKKQKIGDVLVSESIIPYEIKKLNSIKDVHRGGTYKASLLLYNRFVNHKNWENLFSFTTNPITFSSDIIHGNVLSGEKLIDDSEELEKLVKDFPEAIGGEMEGTGLAAACEGAKKDWIIIKAICDFADGNKSANKKENQEIAAKASVGFCKSVFSEDHVFAESIEDCTGKCSVIETSNADLNDVLFKRYSEKTEPFYLQRDIDSQFNGFLNHYSIWLHGVSGCGKSSVIIRNLKQQNYDVIQVFLMSGGDDGLISILKEILAKLELHFEISKNHAEDTLDQIIIAITEIIVNKFYGAKKIIYLDEIPEYQNNDVFKAFCNALYVISAKVRELKPNINVIFVLSSISSPKDYLTQEQNKISESFKIIKLDYWPNNEIIDLIALINSALGLKFSEEEITQISVASKGSPRVLKNIFRDYISTRDIVNYDLQRVLKEVI